MSAPPAMPRQRMQALKKANDVRVARAGLRRQLQSREASLDSVLDKPPWFIHSMSIFELLLWVPRFGQVRARRLLLRADLSAAKPVGELTVRQRSEIRKLVAG